MRTLLLLLFGGTLVAAQAEQFYARVIAVLDGDTVMVRRNSGPPVKVRLAEIDAPEKAQQGGMDSRKSLSDLVLRQQVSVNTQAVDHYGRLVAHLALDGKSVNEEQVRSGMAWEYSNYHSNKSYIALQNEAQQARRGLWSQANPLPPWQWRLQHAADRTAGQSTMPAKKIGQVDGYGNIGGLREQLPAKHKQVKRMLKDAPDYTCGSKQHCSQMNSCDEAHFYLSHCGVKSLDPNRDGVPCESLCAGSK